MMGGASIAHAQGINVVMNGRAVVFADTPPFEQNGSVLVPLRGVFEQLGAGVNYSASTRTIEAIKGQTDVILRLGESTAYINNQPQPLLQPPVVMNGSTFVPLRFVAQSFGARVNWIAATQTVDIQTGEFAPQAPPQPVAQPVAQPVSDVGDGPVRLARFSDVEGNVTWRPTGDTDWSQGAPNIPLREGAQIWAANGGRAEIQFDDGSWLRLGRNAVATLQTLYSDSNGEYTEIKLSQGIASLNLRSGHSVYQIDTSLVSVKADGPARLRVGAENGVEIAVRDGRADVTGSRGDERLQTGSFLRLADANDRYNVGGLPGPDEWDRWNDVRDGLCSQPDANLPPNIGLVAGDLDSYGVWRQDPRYGAVWTPRVADPDWRPYENGRWVWVNPFGWTWVASEPWGWAPYHYGTWVQEPFGWSWVPGPRQQYWSPAVVHFTKYQGKVCWAPLAPAEVHYPPKIAVAVHGRDWSMNFSIGGCAVYYPQNSQSCAPHPWSNHDINTHHNDAVNIKNIYNNSTTIQNVTNITTYNFVPANGRNGATSTSSATFGHAGGYQPIHDSTGSAFLRGRPVAAPSAGRPPMGGPAEMAPTRESLSPARVFAPAPPEINAVIKRSVFHAPPPATVQPPQPVGIRQMPPAPVGQTGVIWPRRPNPGVMIPASPRLPVAQAPASRPGLAPHPMKPVVNTMAILPISGKEGVSVTITGPNLGGVSALTFNGVPSPFTLKNNTTITTRVPTGAISD
jgi:hypothetical protein